MAIVKKILVVALSILLQSVVADHNSLAYAQKPVIKQSMIDEFLSAAMSNDIGKLSYGMGLGIPVDVRDKKDRTALLIATYANALEAAQLLIKAGADVNAKDDLNDSPYLYAGAEGRLEILKMTVEAGADLESVNRYGGTALTPAAHHGHVEVVRYLLTTNIDINQVNNLGWTALLEAVILGDGGEQHIAIVRALVQAGANKSIADRSGVTPLQHAQSRRYTSMVRILK